MAPEQVSDPMRVDLRSDIWALCAVLYELIAGTTAVQGDDWQRRLAMTTECEIPPLPAREAAATRLWPILERGLQRAPERRFASVGELRSSLARWLDHEERRVETPVTHALPQRSAPRPRRQLQWAQAYHPTAT
jgi:serine/threonine-protein kinase